MVMFTCGLNRMTRFPTRDLYERDKDLKIKEPNVNERKGKIKERFERELE